MNTDTGVRQLIGDCLTISHSMRKIKSMQTPFNRGSIEAVKWNDDWRKLRLHVIRRWAAAAAAVDQLRNERLAGML